MKRILKLQSAEKINNIFKMSVLQAFNTIFDTKDEKKTICISTVKIVKFQISNLKVNLDR